MTIYSKIQVNGSNFEDYQNMEVVRTVSSNNAVPSYWVELDSPYGRHKSDFTVGKQIKIFADKDTAPVTNIFTGIVESIQFRGEGLDEKVRLIGRDYTARLLDQTIQPTVYTTTEVGSIVRNIITNNTSDIGSGGIATTSTTLNRITFNNGTIFDGLKTLSDIALCSFYVDTNQVLQFAAIGSISSNLTFYSGNVWRAVIDSTRQGMANKIWVYGDRVLAAAPQMILKVGSPNVAGNLGSVFTLQTQPFNTKISVNGSNLIGGVFRNQINPVSGTGYLISQLGSQIIFPSGTTYGYYLPASGGSIVADYDRQVPIVKYGESQASINSFGPKNLVISDKSIKDPDTATSILNSKLGLINPLNNVQLYLQGWFTFIPGQTATVNMPDFNINKIAQIVEMRYTFNPINVQSEKVISVRLDNRTIDLIDNIKDLNRRISAIENADKVAADALTRLQYGTGSLLIVGSYWEVRTKYITGSDFRLWPSNNVAPTGSGGTPRMGLLDSGAGLGAGSMSFLLSGTPSYGPMTTVRSGGYTF